MKLGDRDVTFAKHRVDHALKSQLHAVVRREDPRYSIRFQLRNLIRNDHPATSAKDFDVARAPLLKQALDAAAQAITSGKDVAPTLQAQVDRLTTAGFKVDYLALVDGQTLEPIDAPHPGARLLAAAHLGAVRLIDNRPL